LTIGFAELNSYGDGVAKPKCIELPNGLLISILYEDRSALAIDKPPRWLLAPDEWDRTGRNLQLALNSSIGGGDFWASSRNLKYLRYVHRLDGDTSGVLLLAKSPGALRTFSELFESRRVEKTYWAVARGTPKEGAWTCRLKIGPHPRVAGRMKIDERDGKDAETHFRILQTQSGMALVEARPMTGRTHQIRVHLTAAGLEVVGDAIYAANRAPISERFPMALRATALAYPDPFQRKTIQIAAPVAEFLAEFPFDPDMSGKRGSAESHFKSGHAPQAEPQRNPTQQP
jgi:23S rRNA pseudouridine1911/1915/1917 synthase